MTPVEAMTRAIYFLDRGSAPSNKVRAFRRAIEIVEHLGAEETKARVLAGSLRDLDGIGASTGEVITAAVRDLPCTYLARLDRDTRIDPGAGRELLRALRGDCHSHTTWSDGGASVREMALAALDLGHDYLVVTDHSPRLTVAHGLSPDRLRSQLAEIDVLNMELAPFRVLTGMEVDIVDDGSLDLPDDLLACLDIVVASVHRKLSMDPNAMTRRMVMAIANPHTDILGHCTGRKVAGTARSGKGGQGRKPSSFDAEIVFAACAKYDKAVEINCRPERQDPPQELLEMAMAWGTKFAIDTDAHAPGQLEWQAFGCDKAAAAGLDAARIINTWDSDSLVGWAANHPT